MNITLDSNAPVGTTGSSIAGKLTGVKKTESAAKPIEVSESTEVKQANYDMVDFSEDAVKYLAENNSGSETTQTDNATETAVSELLSENSESDEDISALDLYSYTENELRDLLLDGDITRSEYDAEIAKRSGGDLTAEA